MGPKAMTPLSSPVSSNVAALCRSQQVQLVVDDDTKVLLHLRAPVTHVGVAEAEREPLDGGNVVDEVQVPFASRGQTSARRRVDAIGPLSIEHVDAEARDLERQQG